MLSQRVNKTIIIFIICALLSSGLLAMAVVTHKPNINNCTIEELQEIRGIGEILSNRISLYLDSNKNATFKDIDDIEGIGEYRIKLLKKRWSD